MASMISHLYLVAKALELLFQVEEDSSLGALLGKESLSLGKEKAEESSPLEVPTLNTQ